MDNLVKYLKNRITDKMTLEDIVSTFEQMCRMPIENDMILFETGTFSFTGEPLFYFSLVRQFPVYQLNPLNPVFLIFKPYVFSLVFLYQPKQGDFLYNLIIYYLNLIQENLYYYILDFNFSIAILHLGY